MVYNDYYSATINININAFLNKKVLRSLLKVKIELAWHIAMRSLFCSVQLCVTFLTCPGKSIREESLLILVSSEGVVSNLSAIFARLSFESTYRSKITNQQGCQLKNYVKAWDLLPVLSPDLITWVSFVV